MIGGGALDLETKKTPMRNFAFAAAVTAAAMLAFAASARDETAEPGWITTSNQPCKVWNPEPEANESVTWSGGCKDGLATGKGALKWTENGKPDVEFDGEYNNGKRNGPGVMITPDGKRVEGAWVDDLLITGNGDAI
jgi:hypothetical protein